MEVKFGFYITDIQNKCILRGSVVLMLVGGGGTWNSPSICQGLCL